MRICELREKEVINCRSCERLGFVNDIEFDICSGCVEKIIVPGPCRLFGLLGRDNEYIIPWCCIKQIGNDIILVDINPEEFLSKC